MNGVLKRMKGEELLLLAVLGNARIRHEVDDELDRRATNERYWIRDFWAGRLFAMRKPVARAA